MTIETPRSREIKRLTTPLTFKNSKAYDSKGNLVKCTETLTDVRWIVEPSERLLHKDEILQYAPQSKAASKVRLERGFGNVHDMLLAYESMPWLIGFYYVTLICIGGPIITQNMTFWMYILLVLSVVPLVYLYYLFRSNNNQQTVKTKKADKPKTEEKAPSPVETSQDTGLESLKKYEKEINNLKVLFDVKQKGVRKLIKKRFEPPQITYDKFISTIDKSEKMFNIQAEEASNIIHLAVEDTPRIESEINAKIDVMKTIISQIEDLTNELVININTSEDSEGEVKVLLEDMENLTDSIKDY